MLSDHIKGVVWDWNGTLLDDSAFALEIMNQMLLRRNLPTLTLDYYRQIFTFPVIRYYQKVGFDFTRESFEIPASEFIVSYNAGVSQCQLQTHALSILKHFKSKGYRQFVLSAMKQDTLDSGLLQCEIRSFFEQVSGLDDHYAHSKTENGIRMMEKMNLKKHELLLIGDTVHDFEVASELGCRCILVANGHQSKEILQETGVPVIDTLHQLLV
jgi:phosphoglycolate phosphatase